MAFYHGLGPVPGAYIYLDAANTSSYPGSGTTWYDISGNGRNFLINASAYKNSFTGNSQVKYMDFRGSFGCAKTSTGALYSPSDTNGITICCWTRILETTTNWRTLLRGVDTGQNDHQIICESGGVRLGMYDNVNATGFNDSGFNVMSLPGYPLSPSPGTGTLVQTNQMWVMMVWQFQNISPYYQFKLNNNPTVLGAITSANARFKSGISSLGAYGNNAFTDVNAASQYWGDIAVFQLYERLLTQAEINQNYEAFAERFNGGHDPDAGTSKKYINVFPGLISAPTAEQRGATLFNDGVNSQWVYPGVQRNLFPHPYAAAGDDGSFQLSYNYDGPGGATFTYAKGVANPVNAPAVLRYYTGNTGYKYWAIRAIIPQQDKTPVAKNVMVSYYARLVGGPTIPSNIGNSQLFRDEGIADRGVTGDWNPTFTSEWKRYSCYGLVTNTFNFFPIHSGTLTGGYTIEFCGFQAEVGTTLSDFATAPMLGTGSLRYRSIFTHGYIAGGYKGSNPWRSVNRTWHATDITMYCGEQLAYAACYMEGLFGDLNGYVLNGADAYATASPIVQSYSLSNGTIRTRGSSTYSPPASGFVPTDTGTGGVGGINRQASLGPYVGGAVNQIGQYGYASGGNTSNVVDKMSFATEIMIATTAAPAGAGYHSGCHGTNTGWWSLNGNKYANNFSNDTWFTYTNSHNTGWYKFLSTKWGHHYGSTDGITVLKFSDSTGANISSGTARPRSVSEENFQMGQDWGYMLGQYDGQQTNQTVKYNHSNDVCIQLGVAAQPKGHFGQSSAACSSAAASICSAYGATGL